MKIIFFGKNRKWDYLSAKWVITYKINEFEVKT